MSFDVSRRDHNGILKGDFPQESGQFPISVVTDIYPFIFPCENCRVMCLHIVGEQHAGLGIKIPFFSKPLASTGKGYHAICNQCTHINSRLTKEMFSKLRSGVIPLEIANLYLDVANQGQPTPYSDDFNQGYIKLLANEREEVRKYVASVLGHYKLEKR